VAHLIIFISKNGKKNPYKLPDFHVFQNHSEIFWHVAKICQNKKKKNTLPRTG
jgi:hypothetical protein